MNIWLFSAFEVTPVDNTRPMRFMGIANAALHRGHKVTFINSTFQHSSKKQRYNKTTRINVNESYELVFVHSKPYYKNVSLKRYFAHDNLANNLIKVLNQRNDKPDAIVISLPPINTVVEVCKWAKLNNVSVIVDVIDPWPDVFLNVVPDKLRIFAKLFLIPFYRKLNYIFNNCDGITAISDAYVQWALIFSAQRKPHKCFYPAIQSEEISNAVKKYEKSIVKNENILRVIYAGSLASSYDIPTILAAAEIIEQKYPGQTEFAIAGAGPQEAIIYQKMQRLPNIRFLGWLGQDDLYREFFLSHVGLIQHVLGATQSVTYKLFDYLSFGLPILNSLESEMAKIITDHEVGFNNNSGDPVALAMNIEKFINNKGLLQKYRNNAIQLSAVKGDASIVYDELIQFIETLAPKNLE